MQTTMLDKEFYCNIYGVLMTASEPLLEACNLYTFLYVLLCSISSPDLSKTLKIHGLVHGFRKKKLSTLRTFL